MLLPLLLAAATAGATDLGWEGHFRTRGLLYDSLSLSDENPQAEGASSSLDLRLKLQPRWVLSDRIALRAQVDALSLVPWGVAPEAWTDVSTGEATLLAWEDTQVSPTTEEGGSLPADLTLTRAWAELYTDIGRFRFGRMPLHWGTGIWLNSGNAPDAEYGDTADRLQFTSRVGLVYVTAAWDVQYEGYLNARDDMQTANLAVSYETETTGVGFYNRYRFQPSQEFGAYSGDLWFHALLGPARIDAEVVGTFGSGNLENGANDVQISAIGAILTAEVDLDRFEGGVEGGLATGDADPDDEVIRTFAFDRDHNISLFLFEEPMPTLEAAAANATNGGRDYGAVRTGEGIRNALYVRPHIGYRILPNLTADAALLAARAAKLPDAEADRRGYGLEVDLSLRYEPYDHVSFLGGFGAFMPGKYFSEYEDPDLGGDFSRTALGGILMGTVEF